MNPTSLIPLEKLISRLRTDLKLSETYESSLPMNYPKPGIQVQKKNLKKASILYYLEELQRIQSQKL